MLWHSVEGGMFFMDRDHQWVLLKHVYNIVSATVVKFIYIFYFKFKV